MWTAQEGHAEIAKLLLERGAESIEDNVMMDNQY
jgi:ankyrin repeat protein